VRKVFVRRRASCGRGTARGEWRQVKRAPRLFQSLELKK
jgi:hypothetical protein